MLLIATGVFLFMLIGYSLLMGTFVTLLITIVSIGFVGIASLVIFGVLWEFYFPKPAKTLIAHKRASSFELKCDDVGFADLLPSHRYLPEGLIKYKFGWVLLPRPIRKFFTEMKLKRKPGRKAKNPDDEAKRQKEYQALQKQELDNEDRERELAEQIALKKFTLKGMGKPLWLQYEGLAANFNPQVLVPLEAKQDNPHLYFRQFEEIINDMDLTEASKTKILEKLGELKSHVEKIRVVIDPRRFKEIHPKCYTQSQIDAHGRIHEEYGRLSVTGFPIAKIMMILVIAVVIIGALGVVYFMFLKPQATQPQPAQQIISLIASKLLRF